MKKKKKSAQHSHIASSFSSVAFHCSPTNCLHFLFFPCTKLIHIQVEPLGHIPPLLSCPSVQLFDLVLVHLGDDRSSELHGGTCGVKKQTKTNETLFCLSAAAQGVLRGRRFNLDRANSTGMLSRTPLQGASDKKKESDNRRR